MVMEKWLNFLVLLLNFFLLFIWNQVEMFEKFNHLLLMAKCSPSSYAIMSQYVKAHCNKRGKKLYLLILNSVELEIQIMIAYSSHYFSPSFACLLWDYVTQPNYTMMCSLRCFLWGSSHCHLEVFFVIPSSVHCLKLWLEPFGRSTSIWQ